MNPYELALCGLVVTARESDGFVNATQLCNAGKKRFNDWYRTTVAKELIIQLEADRHLITGQSVIRVVDQRVGRYGGSWVHPDLAVPLAQWVSPTFTLKVSKWVRELFITGKTTLAGKTDQELETLRKKQLELEERCAAEAKHRELLEEKFLAEKARNVKLERQRLALDSFVRNIQALEKNQIFYIATTRQYAAQNRFKFGGVKNPKDLRGRLAQYKTGRPSGDAYYYAKIYKCHDYKSVEERFHTILSQFKDKLESRREMVHLRYDLLLEVSELIVDNIDREASFINSKCQEYLSQTIYEEPLIPEPVDLSDYIEVMITKAGVERRAARINISGWSEEKIDQKIREIVEAAAREKYPDYSLAHHIAIREIELLWIDISSKLKTLNSGLSLIEWRRRFKKWFLGQGTIKLKIKGLKLSIAAE